FFPSLHPMVQTKKKRWWKGLQIAVLIYFLIGIALHFFQDKLIFRPVKLPADYRYQFSIPFQQIDLPVNTEKNLSIVQFTVPDSLRKGIVLYFHGNRENINRYASFAPGFTKNGYEVWMMDYPGYGKSTGKRTEKQLYEDALIFYKMAIGRVSAEHIIFYGKSLGSGIAAQLATVRSCKRLILETPYYDFPAVFRRYLPLYPYDWILKYKIPTGENMQYISAPIHIFHGTSDGVIAYRNARRLSKNFKPGDELITIKGGGHNNLFDYPLSVQKLDSLLRLP
ncbi:MAG: alpha/beta fold hydrolase, partial [Chitinophagaceae bacterium]|nr:alpha/beta fold hydrolase [Chitinophagaceae bacterium]